MLEWHLFGAKSRLFRPKSQHFSVHILSRGIRPQSFLFYYMCCIRVWEISLDQYTFYVLETHIMYFIRRCWFLKCSEEIHYVPIGDGDMWYYVPVDDRWEEVLGRNVYTYRVHKITNVPLFKKLVPQKKIMSRSFLHSRTLIVTTFVSVLYSRFTYERIVQVRAFTHTQGKTLDKEGGSIRYTFFWRV